MKEGSIWEDKIKVKLSFHIFWEAQKYFRRFAPNFVKTDYHLMNQLPTHQINDMTVINWIKRLIFKWLMYKKKSKGLVSSD